LKPDQSFFTFFLLRIFNERNDKKKGEEEVSEREMERGKEKEQTKKKQWVVPI